MINLENISVHLGSKTILDSLSCSIKQGDFIVIVGSNGAGKTTFFNTITGKCTPTHGSIFLNNQNITQMKEQQRALIISRLFQNPLLNCVPSMNVAENISIALYKGKRIGLKKGIDAKVQSKLKDIAILLDMDPHELKHKKMSSLSGGQRQTIALAMATFIQPQLLLLDEPTAALDPQAATKMLCFAIDYIKQNQLTTILITHDPRLALSLGNKIWILDKGKIIKQIDKAETNNFSTSDLIGQINYEKINQMNR